MEWVIDEGDEKEVADAEATFTTRADRGVLRRTLCTKKNENRAIRPGISVNEEV